MLIKLFLALIEFASRFFSLPMYGEFLGLVFDFSLYRSLLDHGTVTHQPYFRLAASLIAVCKHLE